MTFTTYQVDAIDDFILEFHEPGQSLVLNNKIKLRTSVYFWFKKNVDKSLVKIVRMTTKSLLNTRKNPCDVKNHYREEKMSNQISTKIGCNPQWFSFKKPNMKDCQTENEMKAYYEYSQKIDQMEEFWPNCHQKEWKAEEFVSDTVGPSNISKVTLSLLTFEETVSLHFSLKATILIKILG